MTDSPSNYLFLCGKHAPEGLLAEEYATRPLAAECRVCGAEATRWYTNDRAVLKALLKERAEKPPGDGRAAETTGDGAK